MQGSSENFKIMRSKSILIIILLISLTLAFYGRKLDTSAQETKGGTSKFSSSSSSSSTDQSIKGGLGFSSFKKNILSVQQQQRPIVTNSVIQSSVSSSSIARPVAPSISTVNQVVEEVSTQQQSGGDAEPTIYGSVAGTPGIDFPGYTSIPNTRFSCEGRPFDPGMYADESTGCQVYHLCYNGRRESFLCGIGTVFNQAILNCDFWHSVDCSKSAQYYHLNSEFGKASAEGGGGGSSFSKQEISSVLSAVARRPAIISSKLVSNQQVTNQVVQPVGFNQRVESFSSSSTGKISPPKFVSSGKTSSVLENWRSSDVLSPSRRFQLTRSESRQVEGLQQQSQNEVKVVSKTNPVVGSSLFVVGSQGGEQSGSATDMEENSANEVMFRRTGTGTGTGNGNGNGNGNGIGGATVRVPLVVSNNKATGTQTQLDSNWKPQNQEQKWPPANQQNELNEWKPYFKSKTSGQNNGAASIAPQTSTTPASSTEPQATSTGAKPDQEPVFTNLVEQPAGDNNETSGTATEVPEPPTSGPPAGAAEPSSAEPDVSPALTTSSPAPPPTTTTTTASVSSEPAPEGSSVTYETPSTTSSP